MEAYRLVLESQLGPRNGTLRLENSGASVTGTLTLLDMENPVSGVWIGAHSLRLSHHLRTAVSDLVCESVFELEGDEILGTLQISHNRMRWHGERISMEKGEIEHNDGA